jgi:hypothetical protein
MMRCVVDRDRLRMLRRRGCLAAVTLAGSLVVATAAQAKVVVGQSIDGARLGMNHAQVARILGKGTLAPGGGSQYEYRHGSYQVIFTAGRASTVETFNRDQRTANGLGVGSSLARVRAREPGLHCGSSNGERDCYLGTIKRGHRYTDFFFENGPSSMTAVIVGEGYV